MSGDVDKLQESIDSLVRSMGLEPNSNSNSNSSSITGGGGGDTIMGDSNSNGFDNIGMGMGNMGGMGDEGFDPNFDVDQFLTELAKSEKQIQDQEETKPKV